MPAVTVDNRLTPVPALRQFLQFLRRGLPGAVGLCWGYVQQLWMLVAVDSVDSLSRVVRLKNAPIAVPSVRGPIPSDCVTIPSRQQVFPELQS